jgi:glycosyltransferase involved in cell wall biosynthesis
MKNNDRRLTESIAITIPAYNEEATIAAVFRQARSAISKITDNYEIVLVDDGSRDNTGTIMDTLKRNYRAHTVVVHHKNNKGFSGAMKTCYERASKDLIFLGPADGQFNYLEVQWFVDAIRDKDVVVAYRIFNQEPWYRKINSFVYHALARLLFGIKLRELSSCIMYRRSVRDAIEISADPYSCLFLSEFIYKAMHKDYRIGQVPIHFYKRKGGKAKGTNPKMIIKTIAEMFRFWFDIRRGVVRL